MKQATLTRYKTGDTGTFGKMLYGEHECFTGELADLGNAPEISCIPDGTYLCKWTYSNRFKRAMYQVMDVPERTGIRFHSANWMGKKDEGYQCQLNGCIAPGSKQGMVGSQEGVSGSKDATKDFETWGAGEDFMLTIVNEYLETGEPDAGDVA